MFLALMWGCGSSEAPVPEGPAVRFETTAGDYTITTFESLAPGTTANFLEYVDEGFYDGSDGLGATQFHRVVPGFVVQGGGVDAEGVEKATRDPILNESRDSGLKNLLGTVAMARTFDPDSATSQWFVNVVDNGFLDRGDGYAVFGVVTEGLEVVLDMQGVELAFEQPVPPILIESASRSTDPAP